jgi:alpha-beta hydrolase superfamily lysophospholipase
MRRLRWAAVPLVLAACAVLAGTLAFPRLAAMALILRVAKQKGLPARFAQAFAGKIREEPVIALPTRHGPMDARLYRPAKPARRTVILVPGLHMDGVREERLVGLARELAAAGVAVLTIAPPALTRYRVTADITDQLEDAIAWAAGRPELAPDGRVGVIGISFAGGLAVVAAGRPAVRQRIAFVLSFGGHGDLLRVLRYLCLGQTDTIDAPLRALAVGGQHIHVPAPHDYGGVVTLLNFAARVVPAAQVAPLEEAITTFLEASSIDRLDPPRAVSYFARARTLGAAMPEPSRTLMRQVSDRDVAGLGQSLAPLLVDLELPAALSPERSPAPFAPVFLLHGADDSVVPASEMLFLAHRLQASTKVRAFASRLITHAEANRSAALAEMWQLAGFWQEMLAN